MINKSTRVTCMHGGSVATSLSIYIHLALVSGTQHGLLHIAGHSYVYLYTTVVNRHQLLAVAALRISIEYSRCSTQYTNTHIQ